MALKSLFARDVKRRILLFLAHARVALFVMKKLAIVMSKKDQGKCNHLWRESFLKRYCAFCGKEQKINIENLIWFLEELQSDWQWKNGYPKYKRELEILDKTLNELREIGKIK